MATLPRLVSPNLTITILKPEDYSYLMQYEKNNRQHLAQWEPIRETNYYSELATQKRIRESYNDFIAKKSVTFAAFNQNNSAIIALCTFSNIIQGVFQACNLGYSIDRNYQGKGLMFEMLSTSISYIFGEFKLHRIMANYQPNNHRSKKLLQHLGFEYEGLAKSYLKIAGTWQDHVLTAKINPQHVSNKSKKN